MVKHIFYLASYTVWVELRTSKKETETTQINVHRKLINNWLLCFIFSIFNVILATVLINVIYE